MIVRFCVRFSFFCSEPQKGKKRQSTTNDAYNIIIATLSLSLSCRSRHTDARTRKEETKNHIVQSLLHVKLRGKETKLVRVCPLLLLFAANDARICCFFLSGCETTTDETLFLCDGFCCVVCSSLPRRARARERERQTDRQRDTSSFFRDDAFCVFSKRGVKNILIEREDDEKKMIERARNDGSLPRWNIIIHLAFVSKRD